MKSYSNLLVALILSLCLSIPGEVYACWSATNDPIHQPHDVLVQQTKRIVLARFLRREPQGNVKEIVINHFETVENLKGMTQKRFKSESYEIGGFTHHGTFNHHEDLSFWQQRAGRFGYEDDSCRRPIPKFIPGNMYLLFIGSEDSKAYELIEDPSRDRWYQYAKSQSQQ